MIVLELCLVLTTLIIPPEGWSTVLEWPTPARCNATKAKGTERGRLFQAERPCLLLSKNKHTEWVGKATAQATFKRHSKRSKTKHFSYKTKSYLSLPLDITVGQCPTVNINALISQMAPERNSQSIADHVHDSKTTNVDFQTEWDIVHNYISHTTSNCLSSAT